MWQRDFPADNQDMWDIVAKALMLRAGGSVHLGAEELREAAATQAEIELKQNGSLAFRAERQ